ncbi:MAG: hypothetical protein R6X02_10065 [Enhygromyxa sp.]
MNRRGWTLTIMLLALACTSSESPPTRVEASKLGKPERPASPPAPAPPTSEEPEAAAVTREVASGPAEVASPEQRRAAVLAILTDGSTASHLPLDADPSGD